VQIVVNDEHRELSKINPSMSSISQIESVRVIELIK
jgi:hypothetical protein